MVPPIRLGFERGSSGRAGSRLAGSSVTSTLSSTGWMLLLEGVSAASFDPVFSAGEDTTFWDAKVCPPVRIEPVRKIPAVALSKNRRIALPIQGVYRRSIWMLV